VKKDRPRRKESKVERKWRWKGEREKEKEEEEEEEKGREEETHEGDEPIDNKFHFGGFCDRLTPILRT